MLALRVLIDTEDKHAPLPGRGAREPREDGTPVYEVDFTLGPDDSYNKPLLVKAAARVS